MFGKSLRAVIGAFAVFSLAACTEEDPTTIGGDDLAGNELITFEVVVPASSFLLFDTSFTGYSKASDATFGMVARVEEAGQVVLRANQLYRFSLPPTVISVRLATNNQVVPDSAPVYFAGRLVLKLDTVVVPGTRPARYTLFRTTQEWDGSATWTHAVDSGSVHTPWTTPGGTRGAVIDTATYEAGDSLVFDVDSATLAIWRDTANKARGALIAAETPGARIRIASATVRLSTRPSVRPDTTYNFDIVPTHRTFVFEPNAPGTTRQLRVGGIPAWRTVFRLRSDLETLSFPCPTSQGICNVPLDSANITLAQLLLKPIKSPAGFEPEDTTLIDVRGLTLSPAIPLERSPLGNRIVEGADIAVVAPQLFASPTATDVVRINITGFLAHLTSSIEPEDRLPPYITLLQVPEPSTFGFAAFEPGPSLRLVLTTAARNIND